MVQCRETKKDGKEERKSGNQIKKSGKVIRHYSLTSWSKVLLEKLAVTQLVKKFRDL